MILSCQQFQEHLEKKYKYDFDLIPIDDDLQDLFQDISSYLKTDIYVKLLSFIDMLDFDNFQRFFFISMRKFYVDDYNNLDIENIKDDIVLQLLCLICLQYYFL